MCLKPALFAALLALPSAYAAEEVSRLTLPLDEKPVETPTTRPYSLLFDMELRDQQDLRDRPANRSRQDVHEISFGGSYRFDPHVTVALELSMEQIKQESTFYAKQAYVDWRPWTSWARVRLGQQFLPVGLINERDNLFSSNPPFMQKMFAASKGIDLGAILDAYPLGNEWVYLEGGVFAGRFVRQPDQREDAPEVAPRVFSVKSHSPFHDAFVSYFEHHLSFFDPIHAWGAGFELRSPEWYRISASLLSEYWRFEQEQSVGPNEWDRALMVFATVKWWRFTAGYRWSENHAKMESNLGDESLPLEVSKLALFEVEVAKPFSLRAERVLETQNETLRNEWVARALVHWQM